MRRSPRLGGRRADGNGALARSLARQSASFFCWEAAFNLQLTRRLIRREPREPEEGATRARDIIIKSVCKVGCARSLGRCQRRVVSFAIQAPHLHGRQVDKSYRSPLAPRGNDLAPPPSIVNAVENEICPLSLSLYPSRRRAS